MKRIQDKYKEDPLLQKEKVMEMYKKHGFNPMLGCLPLLFQWPVLAGLWAAISQFQFRFGEAHFLWINPVAAAAWLKFSFPAPFDFLNAAVAPSLAQQDLFLLLFYVASMYVQMKMTASYRSRAGRTAASDVHHDAVHVLHHDASMAFAVRICALLVPVEPHVGGTAMVDYQNHPRHRRPSNSTMKGVRLRL